MKKLYFMHTVALYFLFSLLPIYAESVDSVKKFISYMEKEHGFDSKELSLFSHLNFFYLFS